MWGEPKGAVSRAGLPYIRFRDLRHTCATLLLTKGVHPKIVSEMLGHSSITVILDTYSHVIPGHGDSSCYCDGRSFGLGCRTVRVRRD